MRGDVERSLLRHRQTNGPERDRLNLNDRAPPPAELQIQSCSAHDLQLNRFSEFSRLISSKLSTCRSTLSADCSAPKAKVGPIRSRHARLPDSKDPCFTGRIVSAEYFGPTASIKVMRTPIKCGFRSGSGSPAGSRFNEIVNNDPHPYSAGLLVRICHEVCNRSLTH
jgi:hypothetical protein